MQDYLNFTEKLEALKKEMENFKVLDITKTEKMTLVKATIYCPVYFAFYSHFIVCSGDYGEWVFDCTWETNKKQIPESLGYLLGKLSRDCKKVHFSYSKIESNFLKAKKHFMESHVEEGDLSEETLEELNELWDDFLSEMKGSDEYRIVGIVDRYSEQICDLLDIYEETEDWVDFYEAGEDINPQLMVNLAMLNKLREMNILFNHEGLKDD